MKNHRLTILFAIAIIMVQNFGHQSMIPVIHADASPILTNVPLASDDGQDPVMIIWTGYSPSSWVASNLPDWTDTAYCSGPKVIEGKQYNSTLEQPDPNRPSCIGPRYHVRIWDMGEDSNFGRWSLGSAHHEHTVCDPLCHHVIDNWQSALSALRSSLEGGRATVSISTVSIGNAGLYQGVQFDGSVLRVELSPPADNNQIIFNENGLDPGTTWSVTMQGRTISSTDSTITFWQPKGKFSFTVNAPAGYQATPASGIVNTVEGGAVQKVSFNVAWTSSEMSVESSDGQAVLLGFSGNATVTNPSIARGSAYSIVLRLTITELGPSGVMNITIPKSAVAIGSSFKILVDGSQVQHVITKQDSTNFYVSFNIAHGSHTILVEAAPWYSFFVSPLVLSTVLAPVATALAIMVWIWKRRRGDQLKINSASTAKSSVLKEHLCFLLT